MKLKWCISSLLIIFITLGSLQESFTVPNQEIVLEFVDFKIAKKDIDSTIFDVKAKLLKAGATNIEVKETKNGALKISYYSVVNADHIKEILSKDTVFAQNNTSNNKEENFPSTEKESTYNLAVYELHTDVEIANLDTNSIFEIKYDSQRFSTNPNYVSLANIHVQEANKLFEIKYSFYKNLLINSDYKLHSKPEVRAGPIFYNI